MRDVVERNSAATRIRTWVLGLLAGVALAVAIVGIYGLLAYAVTVRRHELAVRLALGAQPRNVLKLVLIQGLALALAGLAVGLAAAMLLESVLDTLVFGVSSHDPATFLSVAALLLIAVVCACYLPAHRAARTDPVVALRPET
jgi:putative ABC transport system permease protein